MTTSPSLDELYHEYGSKAAAVEPGGVEPIPAQDRHGRPLQMFWTWVSPNMEFATIFVGVIAVLFFGLTFWQAVAAIVVGTALGSLFHAILTSWGPEHGLCQMVISRRAFGYRGNLLPAGINAVVAGVGWFAVNSISGALALSALTGWNGYVCLVIGMVLMLIVAFLGHNFVHVFERVAFPVLVVIFLAGMAVILPATQTGPVGDPVPGGFWITVGATFGYAAGWNPFASDYSRYLPRSAGKWAGIYAGLGVFLSATALEIAGAAAVTAVGTANWNPANPTGSYVSLLPAWLAAVTLLAIFIGAISANALNLYSAGMSFAALGLRLPTAFGRAALTVGMGLAGFVVAIFALDHVETYEGFLLVISYWIGPWLGVVMADRLLDKTRDDLTPYVDHRHVNLAGPIAMAVAMVVSIFLFSNQQLYTGLLVKAAPSIGDIAFEVGFVIAFAVYAGLRSVLASRTAATTA
jgi:NCS1 family nucleobase:cation symporter-1